MASFSDTESESGESPVDWDVADFLEMSTELGRIRDASNPAQGYTHELYNSIKALQNMDICAAETDDHLQESIRHISNTILWCLDHVTGSDALQGEDGNESRESMQMLLNAQFLSLLFEYRALFHSIAARNSGGLGASVIVCWADVILARLGKAIVVAAGSFFGVTIPYDDQPDAVRAQKEDDMLRAAVQLPEKWTDVINVLCSEHASQAARRLAFSLVFGVNVMHPRLTGQDAAVTITQHDRTALLRILQLRLKRMAANKPYSLNVRDANDQERVMYAMFVSLYAVAQSGSSSDLESPYQPQSQSCLSEMIEAVLLRYTSSASPIASPMFPVDTAVIILIKWGVTLPWAWATWDDARRHGANLVEHLTVIWLHNLGEPAYDIVLGHSVDYWDDDLSSALETKPHAALSTMARILISTLDAIKTASSGFLSKAVLDVVMKTSWSTKHILRITDVDPSSIMALYRVICDLVLLLPDEQAELGIKDLLIEALSLSANGLQGVAKVISDSTNECSIYLDRRLVSMCRVIYEAKTYIELRAIRQTLQFVTMVWAAGVGACFIPESVHRLISTLLKWSECVDSNGAAWLMLGDAVVGVFVTFERRQEDPARMVDRSYNDTLLWTLAYKADPADLQFASSLGAYITNSANRCKVDNLVWAENWDYLRDVLLLILTREFEGTDEPLALLVAPTICRGLLSLAQYAQETTFRYFIYSPWTTCMTSHLEKLRLPRDRVEEREYLTVLRERICDVFERLCKQMLTVLHRFLRGEIRTSHPWKQCFAGFVQYPIL